MKIVLEYNPTDRNITDSGGNYIGMLTAGVEPEEVSDAPAETVELIKLGVSPEDVIKLKHNGLI